MKWGVVQSGCLYVREAMTENISPTDLAPELDSPPLSPRISAFRCAWYF